jgi:ABC-type multidrug transport system fused ATPase/permease subunit
VAVVVESGCGKSTLVNLILRFYEPTEGEVLINGIKIKKYNLEELRKRMGYVMQELTLFNYSIKENILYGDTFARNLDILEASTIANAIEFIENQSFSAAFEDSASVLQRAFLERQQEVISIAGQDYFDIVIKKLEHLVKKEELEGKFVSGKGDMDERTEDLKDIKDLSTVFEFECGVKGRKLSGGQKQRIAIARAVVRKPNIRILDEATSALDESSQRKVQLALDNVMQNRTSIVIAHRLTTVEKCTRVVVIEDGKVVEEAKFNDLKNREDGFFHNLAAGMQKAENLYKKLVDKEDILGSQAHLMPVSHSYNELHTL